jgi:hypothetical protein
MKRKLKVSFRILTRKQGFLSLRSSRLNKSIVQKQAIAKQLCFKIPCITIISNLNVQIDKK